MISKVQLHSGFLNFFKTKTSILLTISNNLKVPVSERVRYQSLTLTNRARISPRPESLMFCVIQARIQIFQTVGFKCFNIWIWIFEINYKRIWI